MPASFAHHQSPDRGNQVEDVMLVANIIHKNWLQRAPKLGFPIEVGPTQADANRLLEVAANKTVADKCKADPVYYWENLYAFHAAVRWRQCGFPCFQLTHGLAAALLLTDCSKVRGDELRAPFPTFFVELPFPESPITITDEEGNRLPVRWLKFHKMVLPGYEGTRSGVEFDWKDDKGGYPPGCEPPEELETVSLWLYGRDHKGGSVQLWREHPWVTEADLEEWLTSDVHLTESLDTSSDTTPPHSEANAPGIMAAIRLITNLCLYVAEQKRDQAEEPKKKKKKRPRGPSHRIVLGTGVKLPRAMRMAAASMSCDPKWRIKQRFVVRGHWRNQACGKKQLEHKRIWVAPYWKGPRDGPSIKRTYEVATNG